MTALACVAKNDLNGLRILCQHALQNRYDLEETDAYGNTPLLKACYLTRLEAVQMLLRSGASIKAINYLGQNALTLATYAGSSKVVLELLNHRSLEDFNLSSVIPAYCVATLLQDQKLMGIFWNINKRSCMTVTTSHGLTAQHIDDMVHRYNARK